MPETNGYDRFLENMYGRSGYFFHNLFATIRSADAENLSRLAAGFPQEVDAYRLYREEGPEALAAKVSPDHPLLKLWCRDEPDVDAMFKLVRARSCPTS
jgi:hypothetical protein